MAVGILLVGGFGTRLKPLTNHIPKPMLNVGGLPVTEHQLLAAKKAGISTVVLATSYMSEIFTPYFGDGSKWGMKLLYAVEKEPLGTGGAIRNAFEAISDTKEPVVIFNGDILSHHDLAAQIRFHKEKGADVTLHLIDVEDARAFGCVPTDPQGRVEAFLEKMDKPVTNSINAGCYIFNPEVIRKIPAGKVVSVERETFPALVGDGKVFGYREQSYWLDIGTPAALFQGSRDFVGREFTAGDGTQIAPSAKITGGSSIGKNCTIGVDVRIDNSILCDGVEVGDGAKIDNSFIANDVRVGAHLEISRSFLSQKGLEPITLP